MSGGLNIRARFPDGKMETLTDLSGEMTYGVLLEELKTRANLKAVPQKVLVAGFPPRAIESDAEATLESFLKTGDSLIVEPVGRVESAGPAAARGRRRKKTMVQKAEEKLKKRDAAPTLKRGRVVTLATTSKGRGKGKRPGGVVDLEEDDDPRDGDWEEGASDEEEKPVATRRSKRKRTQAANGTGLGEGGFDPLNMQAAEEGLGLALVESLTKDPTKLDVTGKKFKDSLQSALAERQAEAAGETRYAAWLGKVYKFEMLGGGEMFTVEIKEMEGRRWKKDMDGATVAVYGKELLAAAFKDVLTGATAADDREKLRASEMAKVSPRIFWNMVRLFPEGIEEGVRELVPDFDWSFMDHRRRMLTAKGRRNLENKEVMGWESD